MAHIAVIDTWHYLSFHNLSILWKNQMDTQLEYLSCIMLYYRNTQW